MEHPCSIFTMFGKRHSYDNYCRHMKYPTWIYVRMSSQTLMKVPRDPQHQRRLGLALHSYVYTHELNNIRTNTKAGGGV